MFKLRFLSLESSTLIEIHKFTHSFLVIECGNSSLWDDQESIHPCFQNNRVSVREEKGIYCQRSSSAIWLHGGFQLGSANP